MSIETDVNAAKKIGHLNMINTYVCKPLVAKHFIEAVADVPSGAESMFGEVGNGLIGLRVYPFIIPASAYTNTDEAMVCGTYIDYSDTSRRSGGIFTLSDTIKIARITSDFRDYEMKLQMYLPFVGFINLDPKIYLNKNITVTYAIEIVTGEVIVYLSIDDTLYETIRGTAGQEVPIAFQSSNIRASLSTMTSSLMSVTGTLALAKTMDPALGLMSTGVIGRRVSASVASEAMNIIPTPSNEMKGTYGAGAPATIAPLSIYVTKSYRDFTQARNSDYRAKFGIPLREVHKISDMTGYTVCSGIHPESMSFATKDEIDEIVSILQSGFHAS